MLGNANNYSADTMSFFSEVANRSFFLHKAIMQHVLSAPNTNI